MVTGSLSDLAKIVCRNVVQLYNISGVKNCSREEYRRASEAYIEEQSKFFDPEPVDHEAAAAGFAYIGDAIDSRKPSPAA